MLSRRVEGVLVSLVSRRVARARSRVVPSMEGLLLLAPGVTLLRPGCTVCTNYERSQFCGCPIKA